MAKEMNFAPKGQREMGTFGLKDKIAAALMKIKKGSKKKTVLRSGAIPAPGGTTGGIVRNASLNKSLKNQFGTGSSGKIH